MIYFNYRFWRVVALLSLLICSGHSLAASMPQAVDVTTASHRMGLNESMVWCQADPAATPSSVLAGGCRWQSMASRDVLGGAWDSVTWMRLALVNSSTMSVERWIKLGHSRTAERS